MHPIFWRQTVSILPGRLSINSVDRCYVAIKHQVQIDAAYRKIKFQYIGFKRQMSAISLRWTQAGSLKSVYLW